MIKAELFINRARMKVSAFFIIASKSWIRNHFPTFSAFLGAIIRIMSNIDNEPIFLYHIQSLRFSDWGKEGARLSSFALRLLALAAMFVDHAGLALFPAVGAFRCVGRISFPIYCFLLTQGFLHTRDVRAYGRRLLLLAILSEIPFDLLIFGRVACGMEQNVLFSLLLGLMALYAAEALRGRPVQAALVILTLCMAAMAARVSYGWLAIALCLCVYYAGENRLRMALSMAATLLLYTLSLALSGVTASWVLVSLCALCSLLPILLYNGRRGARNPLFTFLFYAAYPLHLLALVAIRAMRLVPPYFLR